MTGNKRNYCGSAVLEINKNNCGTKDARVAGRISRKATSKALASGSLHGVKW